MSFEFMQQGRLPSLPMCGLSSSVSSINGKNVLNRADALLSRFCSDHYKTEDHKCTQASATFLVPLCPLCHEPPKHWKRDEDPNIAMNLHLSPDHRTGRIECRAVDEQGVVRDDAKGKQLRVKRENECNERKCKKLMIVPITVSSMQTD